MPSRLQVGGTTLFSPAEQPAHAGSAVCCCHDVWLLLQVSTLADSPASSSAITSTQSVHACFMSGSYLSPHQLQAAISVACRQRDFG